MAKLAECSNRGGGAVIAPDAAGEPIIRGRAPAEAGSVILGVRERAWRFREGPVTQRTMQAAGPELGDAVMNDLRPELAHAIPWKGDAPATPCEQDSRRGRAGGAVPIGRIATRGVGRA